jgi:hypothetical protein
MAQEETKKSSNSQGLVKKASEQNRTADLRFTKPILWFFEKFCYYIANRTDVIQITLSVM